MSNSESATVFEASANELILKAAEELKKNANIKAPAWAPFVKTGTNRERLPEQPDWWYIRAAAVLRQLYLRPQGVQRLRGIYGGRKNMGFKPERFKKGSGNILRKILQQLEKAGYLKKEKVGRVITPIGVQFLDSMAKDVPTLHKLTEERTAVRVAEMAKTYAAPVVQQPKAPQPAPQAKPQQKPQAK